MPFIIPGFEYDIFISYRQKDNKHDRWVSEFVNKLKIYSRSSAAAPINPASASASDLTIAIGS
jgi:hypothetical protein